MMASVGNMLRSWKRRKALMVEHLLIWPYQQNGLINHQSKFTKNAGTYETYNIIHGKLCFLLAGSSYHSFNHPDHGKGSYQPVVADAKLEVGFSNDFVDK